MYPADQNLGSLVAAVARTRPGRNAVWAKGECLTYEQLYSHAAGVARALSLFGVAPNDRVAILSERNTSAYIGVLGILFAAAAYVPLNLRFPADRNRRIVEVSGAKILICSKSQARLAFELSEAVPNLSILVVEEVQPELKFNLPCETASEQASLAYVFFTSGTTGVPKGVPISHANVFAYLRGIRTVTTVSPDDRVMQVVDLTFDLSVHDIFLAWTSGACLYSIPENGTLLATRFVEEHGGTHWLSVPSAAAQVKQVGLLQADCMPSLKYSFFCGEALPVTVAESWTAAAPNSAVINIYGPTEATVAFSSYHYQKMVGAGPSVVPLGEPFPEQRMGLFHENLQPVANGTGEICLSGSQVSEGYWNAPEITAERFFENEDGRWYRTGDLGRYEEGFGYIYLGRADRQVKLRGFRVELQEIESGIIAAGGCDLAAVIPWPVDDAGAALGCVAFVVGGENCALILERVRQQLPDYMVPSSIERLDAMPMNSNGKIDHRALTNRLQSSRNEV